MFNIKIKNFSSLLQKKMSRQSIKKELKFMENSSQQLRKISSSDRVIRNNVALEIFDAVATLRTLFADVPTLTVRTAFNTILDGLEEFALALGNENCILSRHWICFLICLLSTLSRNITTVSFKAQFTRIRNVISTLLTVEDASEAAKSPCDCKDICSAITLVFSAILSLLSSTFSFLASTSAIGLDTMVGSGLNTLSISILNLAQAIACFSHDCEPFPCALVDILASLNALTASFIVSTAELGVILTPVTNILTALTVDCLNGITSKSTKASKELKQVFCQLEIAINSLLAIASSPITTITPSTIASLLLPIL